MTSVRTYATFILATFAVGWTSAALFPPSEWYEGLNKAPFNPPNFAFPIAWSLLYIMIGIAGARVWIAELRGLPVLFWIFQLGLNGFWSFLFFGLQAPLLSLIEAFFFLVSIGAFIGVTWRFERTAAVLFVPYFVWVSFAILLNLWIVLYN
ncbi:MAG: TspO/MBR family protein [Pseudomonadota bacterium]